MTLHVPARTPAPCRGRPKAGLSLLEVMIATGIMAASSMALLRLGRIGNQHALRGESFERGAIYWHFPHYSNHGMQSPAGAIREGDYKLIEYFENGTVQLFNLKKDLGEQNDLATAESERAAKLLGKLRAWRKEVDAKMPRLKEDQP